jgi:hypothetical protein
MKSAILDEIRAELRQRLEVMIRAAMAAHAAATDPGSKAEASGGAGGIRADFRRAGVAGFSERR